MLAETMDSSLRGEVTSFSRQWKFSDKRRVSRKDVAAFCDLIEFHEGISVSFLEENPLNLIQTIILSLFVLGGTDKEVSEIVGVTKNTLKGYTERIKHKLGVNTKYEAIIKSIRMGIIKFIY